ncbi:hypothetical protein HRbin02_01492 [Candidatus Calditenuaceae archaeon HR02]|nr:hypothetical protein HRbin02_01492 [Candidatus Calditenuaceae archaeon HR02]
MGYWSPSRLAHLSSAILSAVGLPLSIYLVSPGDLPQFCEIGSRFSCGTVIHSEYSRFMGIPIAYLGAVWFGAALALSLAAVAGLRVGNILLYWSVLGVLGALALLLVEIFIIGSICLLCSFAHAAGAGVFAAAYLARLWSQPPITSG